MPYVLQLTDYVNGSPGAPGAYAYATVDLVAHVNGNKGFQVAENGIQGMAAKHITWQKYATQSIEGNPISRQLVGNRIVNLTLHCDGASFDAIAQSLRQLYAMLTEAGRYASTNGIQGRYVRLTYQPPGSNYINYTQVLGGTFDLEKALASVYTSPGNYLQNIPVQIECEPYFVEDTTSGIHNILFDPILFNSVASYSGNTSGLSIVAANVLGPYAGKLTIPANTAYIVYTPQIASNLQAAGTVYFQAFFNNNVGKNDIIVAVTLQENISGSWVDNTTASYADIDGWSRTYAYATVGANPLRLKIRGFNVNGSVVQSMLFAGLMISNNALGPIPTSPNFSNIMCSYSFFTTGEDKSTIPYKINRCWIKADGPLVDGASSNYTYSFSDARARTTIFAQSSSATANKGFIYAKRTKDASWVYTDSIDETFTGFTFGTYTVNSTQTWALGNNALQFGKTSTPTNMPVNQANMVWRINLANWTTLNSPQTSPSGKWVFGLVLSDAGLTSNYFDLAKFDFWIQQGTTIGNTQPVTDVVAMITNTTAQSRKHIIMGEVDLRPQGDYSRWQASTNYLELWGRNTRGAAGDVALIDNWIIMPADEGWAAITGNPSNAGQGNGQSAVLDITGQAANGLLLNSSNQIQETWAAQGGAGDMSIVPGENYYFAALPLQAYNQWAKNQTNMFYFTIKRQWFAPRSS